MKAADVDQQQVAIMHTQWTLLRNQINSFSQEMISLREEANSGQLEMAQLRKDLTEETSKRYSCDGQARSKHTELVHALDQERSQRTASLDGLRQELASLRLAIEEEGRKRKAGDGDVWGALDKQSSDQAAMENALKQTVHVATSRLDQEATARFACAQSEAEREATQHTLALEEERRERLVEVGALRNAVGEERQKNVQLNELFAGLERRCGELHSLIETKSSNILADASAQLKSLSHALDLEAKERVTSCEEAYQTALQARQAAAKESSDRRALDDDVSRRLQELSVKLDLESSGRRASEDNAVHRLQELSAMVDRESSDQRASGDDAARRLEELSAALDRQFAAEKLARTDALRAMQSMGRQASEQLKALELRLEGEVGERGVALDRLEKLL